MGCITTEVETRDDFAALARSIRALPADCDERHRMDAAEDVLNACRAGRITEPEALRLFRLLWRKGGGT